MTGYRFLWLFVCSLILAPGLAVSVAWPTVSVAALLPVCAFLIGILKLHHNALTMDVAAPAPLRSITRGVVRWALTGGIVMMAFVGLSALVGTWILLIFLLLAGSSPEAVHWLARVRADAGPRSSRGELPRLERSAAAVQRRQVRELTNTELCKAWQETFHALRAATSPACQARIVDARHTYLDEIARRNSAGLVAWMTSGTGVTEDARTVLAPGAGQRETSIDWDAVLYGQDDS